MNPCERPTGRRFLVRPLELERLRALKGEPHYEARIAKAREDLARFVREPLAPWNSGLDENSWVNHDRYLAILNMTTLYLLTGEESYAQAARRDALTIAGVSEAHPDRLLSTDCIQELFVNRALLYAHEWLAEFFSAEERERLRQTSIRCMPHHAWEMARSTVNQKLVQNHLQLDSTDMMTVALYFNDFRDADRWGNFAAETSVRYVKEAFLPDGAQNEVATTYHALVLDIAHYAALGLRDYGGRDLFCEPWFADTLRAGIEWLGALVTPAGTVTPLGDSGERVASWLFRMGASRFGSPHLQALAELLERRGAGPANLLFDLLYYDPSIPARLDAKAARVFTSSSTAALRSGFSEQDGLLVLNGGSYTGGHAHLDRLGFEFWHGGACLLPDAGGLRDRKDWAVFVGYYKQTSSHNVVAIHEPHEEPIERLGKTQSVFSLAHRGHEKSQARITAWSDESSHGALCAQAFIYPGVLQRRALLWLKASGALLVWDRIESDREYVFDQLFHGAGEASADGSAFRFAGERLGLSGSVLAPKDAEVVKLQTPERAVGPRSYLAVRKRGSSVEFLTLLEPFEGSRPPARKLDPSGTLRWQTSEGDVAVRFSPGSLAVSLNGKSVFPIP